MVIDIVVLLECVNNTSGWAFCYVIMRAYCVFVHSRTEEAFHNYWIGFGVLPFLFFLRLVTLKVTYYSRLVGYDWIDI